ncbi:MAG TPA: hypothetical protein VN426_18150 [Syntrophomonadaceae bacterium]|nr:hypothetical protein [Syntrophomonadaceae bacterium]
MGNDFFTCENAKNSTILYNWPNRKITPKSTIYPPGINLVQNPSFETGLTGWVSENTTVTDSIPYEGMQTALLGPGPASIFQDIALSNQQLFPMFLSFNMRSLADDFSNGNLVVELLWLDAGLKTIATGLRETIPGGQFHDSSPINYFNIIFPPPSGTAWAQLQFSKGVGASTSSMAIDQVVLSPIGSANLVQNPGFEAGLQGWITDTFSTTFVDRFEGSVQALASGRGGILYQDIGLASQPAHSSFLLSFAAGADLNGNLSVQLLWLDASNNQIGLPGLDIFIPELTLSVQGGYLTYLDISQPAPTGAVKARIQFRADVSEDTNLFIDQVLLARVATANLVQNPGFENGLTNWTALETGIVSSSVVYAGSQAARLSDFGGLLFQDIAIAGATGHSLALNFSLGFKNAEESFSGDMLVNVLWLDRNGKEIGLGLSMIIPGFIPTKDHWRVYTGISDSVPPCTASVRVLFSKSAGTLSGIMDIDQVVLGRLL